MEPIHFNPKENNSCFGCGGANPFGLKLSFQYDPESQKIFGEYYPRKEHCGGENILHGGIIATILDEACSKVLSATNKTGLTRNLNIDFLKPITANKKITIHAHCESLKRHKHFLYSEIRNDENQVCAKATALFIVIDKKFKLPS